MIATSVHDSRPVVEVVEKEVEFAPGSKPWCLGNKMVVGRVEIT